MISLYAQSHLSTATLILITCIWIPFHQIKQFILTIFGILFYAFRRTDSVHLHQEAILDLSVWRFQDLEDDQILGIEEICSICLMEFENEDLVNKLPNCRHIFHMACIEKWLDRNQFTCPMCRSLLLHVKASPCKLRPSSAYSTHLINAC
ncbi:RING-H2 finger protein ATL18 [Abeliophyllum distichum]|uniref:RING-H2 finger protein ATL18 n=1 Tax=Abeliophyllum distichum TaxID=126358 RepID=A0ABD1PB51_9LAMI